MDKPFIERLIKVIARQRHVGSEEMEAGYEFKSGFNMNSVVHECGTPSCIAGYAKALLRSDELGNSRVSLVKIRGHGAYQIESDPILENIFGEDSNDLFFPQIDVEKYKVEGIDEDCSIEYHKVTPRDAVQVLRHFVKTEEIDWLKADGFEKFISLDVDRITERSSGKVVFERKINQ